MDDIRNILVFGDSLTWGWKPASPISPTVRHQPGDRWPNILASSLGPGYCVIAEGLNGRTTDIDDPDEPGRNGAVYLAPALASHMPLDLVILLLGTNDTKRHLDRSALAIGLGLGRLIDIVQQSANEQFPGYRAPDILAISPPMLADRIDPDAEDMFSGAHDKLKALPAIYQAIADAAGAALIHAGPVIPVDLIGPDGIHFTKQANQALGQTVASKIKEMLG